jgi:hypothetical protein
MSEHRSRTPLIALLTGAPAIVAALGLTAIEGYRFVQPMSPLFDDAPASLAESITSGSGVEYSYRFIRAGQNPNALIVVASENYSGGRSIRVSPLMLAVAAHDDNTASMLLNFGARLDLPQNRAARCLAEETGDTAMIRIIERHGGSAGQPCLTRKRDAPTPLLAWTD